MTGTTLSYSPVLKEGVLRTTGNGLTWVEVLPLASGVGPVAFSQSHVELAYVIAGDGTAYRSMDIGATWTPVAAAPLAKRSY